MKIRHSLITVSFYFIAFSISALLAYETDLTQEPAYYCPGYANCTGMDCRYNRMSPSSDWASFNMSEIAAIRCDSLEVGFTFPESKDESFVGNETWTCFRYYDGVGHHLALLKITLNKPSDVVGVDVQCKASIGDCSLLNETPSEIVFIAGLPDTCVTWTDDMELMLPSQIEDFQCPHYENCTGDICHYHRQTAQTNIKPFLTNDDSIIRCDPLKVDIFYPPVNSANFTGVENYTCFQYANNNGTTFAVLEINLNKPDDLNSTQLTCSVEPAGNECAQRSETSSSLLVFVAGLPGTCTPWTPPPPPPPTAAAAPPPDTEPWLPAQNQTVDCPHYDKCDENTCHFDGTLTEASSNPFFAGNEILFKCGSLKVDILVPVSKDSQFIGNKTYSCFEYDNGKGIIFPAAEVILKKPDDVQGSEISCTFDGNNCTLQNETDTQVVLVAGFPSSCTPWIPPTPPPTPPPETTTAEPTTAMAAESTVTESNEPPTTVSITTAGTDNTTGASGSPTQASKETTPTPSPVETTKPGDSSVARLELAAVLAMAVAFCIRPYM